MGWLGNEDGVLDGGLGSLAALLRDGRRGIDLGVDDPPPVSVAVFGLLILLANEAPLLACGGLEVVFACWEAAGEVEALERLDDGAPALALAGDREAAWEG